VKRRGPAGDGYGGVEGAFVKKMVTSPTHKADVVHLREAGGCSERKGCALVGISWSMQRFQGMFERSKKRNRFKNQHQALIARGERKPAGMYAVPWCGCYERCG
jgi:hypothetical protein